ncbi:MAG TPA: PQQ-binding-like beta-propeller repeat protein [Polyangiaceae bacterium]|nr:PQQ-binding-like beta-propeller repeat protein [Polyangiaceae bacterium]
MLRPLVAALAIALLSLAAPASARSREPLNFRVDLGTGKVQRLTRLSEPPYRPPWPPPPRDKRRSLATRNGTLIVFDEEPRRGIRKLRWQQTLETGPGWFPWTLIQQNTVTSLWSEEVPGQPHQYREVIRAIDLETREVLWTRVGPSHPDGGAEPLGPDRLLVDQRNEVLLLETKTGKVLRSFRKDADFFSVSQPSPGRIWLEAGERIECLDELTADTLWSVPKSGAVLSLRPIPKSEDWLVQTSSHVYRLRPADGLQAWSAVARGGSPPLLWNNRSYEAWLEGSNPHTLMLVERDLQNGKVLREYVLGQHVGFFDKATVEAISLRAGAVYVVADFFVWE